MPLAWTLEEDEKLVDLVKPHPDLYDSEPSKNKGNILARILTWHQIANEISKPDEECKKRWKSLCYGFSRHKRLGTVVHERRLPIYEKLQFLEVGDQSGSLDTSNLDADDSIEEAMVEEKSSKDATVTGEQVITDNQEYYEIEIVAEPSQAQSAPKKPFIKLVPSNFNTEEPPKKMVKRNVGRKKTVPLPPNLTPVKILPKPLIPIREPRLVRCIETPKTIEQRSQTLDKLIEKVLKENTNEIDVFFRSMAASVKKLQPNLIPKVKMEVCNVIAKYEMQNFDRSSKNVDS